MATNDEHTYFLTGGRVVDPAGGVNDDDLLVAGGRVAARGRDLKPPAGATLIPCDGRLIFPGLVDMHVHLREPGREDKETIASGTRAAVLGGFTTVIAKANTFLVMDNPAVVEFVHSRAERAAYAHVFPVGSITEGLRGFGSLSEIGRLKEAGVVALSDDGVPVVASDVMAQALRYAADFGLVLVAHSEDRGLSGGAVTEGPISSTTGLKGIPPEAEEILVARDLSLLRYYGGRLHVAHVSSAGSLAHIRRAKEEGLDVTCETAPHYLLLTDEAALSFDTRAKMNPPLRSEADRRALIAALADGTVDLIASDHAPHTAAEKDDFFAAAPFGIVGLETTLRLIYTYLVLPGTISIERMVESLTTKPAARLGLAGRGRLAPGDWADVTVFDPAPEGRIQAAAFRSQGRNTPFDGWPVRGQVETVFVDGKPVVWQGLLADENEAGRL
jgi:dihydroorotase